MNRIRCDATYTRRIQFFLLDSMTSIAKSLVTAAAALAFAAPAHAGPQYVEIIKQSIQEQCMPNATQLTARKELEPVFGATPVDNKKVCDCATAAFMSDPRLAQIFNGDDAALAPKLRSEPLISYMSVRLTASVFKCIGPELESSLAPVKLP
ncbi:hypothetical protein BH10PSE17_BH10PSE17_27520 [soil metagenome]